MGTRGYTVYRFRGRYYVYYNHYDSYPTGLGKAVVAGIRTAESGEYESWLASCREEYEILEDEFEDTEWTITLGALENGEFDASDPEDESIPRQLECVPSVWPPSNDLMIEWVYTIDLDREIFSVNNHEHFPLGTIPKDWMEYTPHSHEHGSVYNFMGGDPGKHGMISLEIPPSPADPTLVSAYSSLHPAFVRPKGLDRFPPGKRSAVCFARRLHRQWVESVNSPLEYLIPQWTPSSPMFRELGWATLCLAAGLPGSVKFEDMHALVGNLKKGVFKLPTGNDPSSPLELVADICSGFHVPGESQWRAPSEELFWMEGVLVYLCLNLHHPEIVKASIARLVQEGKASGKTSFHGIVMSLEHVILIKVSPGELVEHTPIMELIAYPYDEPVSEPNETTETETGDKEGAIEGQERRHENSQDVQENGKQVTEAAAKEEPVIGQESNEERLLGKGKQPTQAGDPEETANCQDCRGDNAKGVQEKEEQATEAKATQEQCHEHKPTEDENRATLGQTEKVGGFGINREIDAFAALAHVFEAVRLQQLVRKSIPSRLPTEIYFQIIDHADYPTWLQCMNVSRAWRQHCQTKWIFDHDLALLEDDGETCRLRVLKGDQVDSDAGLHPFVEMPSLERPSQVSFWSMRSLQGTRWIPILGRECGRRVALARGRFAFRDYTRSDDYPVG